MYILYSLITIRFRKFFPRGDKTAVFLFIVAYLSFAYLCYLKFEVIGNYIYLFFADNILYHQKRKDIELLKTSRNFRRIIFSEYLFYSLPLLIVLILKGYLLGLLAVLSVYIIIILLPRAKSLVIKYPFKLLDPYWHIIFRRYKIIYWFPIIALISYMGFKHNNDNIQVFVLIIIVIICSLPAFEREREIEIKISPYSSKKYLSLQLQTCLINTCYLIIPFATILFVNTFYLNMLLILFVIICFPMINVVVKYAYFKIPIMQTFFGLTVVFGYGVAILAIPFCYKMAIKKLNIIKNAYN